MAWFRSLVRVAAIETRKASSNPLSTTPTLYSLKHLSTAASNQRRDPQPTPIQYSGLEPTRPDEKPRVVVLGTGWAGCRLMKDIDTKLYDVVCVSPRNHMVFTPLLASTCVGTLEFRSVAESIGRIQPAISREPGSYFCLANCTSMDTNNHLVC